jgi:Ca-activated chloride channel family protein
VLTDISLDTGDIRTSQIYPAQLPDLFAGTQLVLAGRYRDGGTETITLRGTVNGQEQIFRFEDQQFLQDVPAATAGGNPFIPRLWATRAIGSMMQQIRLHGEDEELVQSIVNLSMRYGIITPYTSFLIEEDDIMEQSGEIPELLLDEATVMEAEEMLAAPAQVFGESAVDRAAMEADLAKAEAPLAMATMAPLEQAGSFSRQPVVSAGSKTFFLRSGILVDSAFDAQMGDPQIVPFASDTYFDLLNMWPEAGEYLALGEEILVVLGGQAYQITAGGEETAVLDSQTEQEIRSGETLEVISNVQTTPAAELSYQEFVEDREPAAGLPVCSAGLALPLLLMSMVGVGGYWRRRH